MDALSLSVWPPTFRPNIFLLCYSFPIIKKYLHCLHCLHCLHFAHPISVFKVEAFFQYLYYLYQIPPPKLAVLPSSHPLPPVTR